MTMVCISVKALLFSNIFKLGEFGTVQENFLTSKITTCVSVCVCVYVCVCVCSCHHGPAAHPWYHSTVVKTLLFLEVPIKLLILQPSHLSVSVA